MADSEVRQQLFDMLAGPPAKSSAEEAPELIDPAKISDEERVVLYKEIITGVLGEEFYNKLGLDENGRNS